MTIGEWIPLAAAALNKFEVHGANLAAQLIAAHVLGKDRSWVLAHPEAPLPELAANAILERRLNEEPFAYIFGRREFYSRTYAVNRHVLIPRQDTEILIDAVLKHPNLDANKPLQVLDIGTGSGCIAITLKLERPNWDVTAIDISSEALQTAVFNAESLGAEIRFLCGDLFDPVKGEKFDLIVSNPPYIGTEEVLPQEVVLYEPAVALLAGPAGEDIYRRMAELGHRYITAHGLLFVEVGYRQAKAVRTIFEADGFQFYAAYPDLQGHQRISAFMAPGSV